MGFEGIEERVFLASRGPRKPMEALWRLLWQVLVMEMAEDGRSCAVQFRRISEVEPPSPLRYLIGAAIMMIGVVLPVGYMMFRNKRVPSTSSYSKQT
ncbi:uncharacterized protein LOC116141996 [Pistacia vera]|uniref:uncharacterized protein LOC116141996 n=1 Tax=Pistacia vera TaxID=55513 RepID=UPI001262B889|nr:uncharacterized protein LOC116141996 [Pistacia vera]